MKSSEGPNPFSSGIDTINESDIDEELFSGNEPSILLERRRRSHTAAEQRRRNAIKRGHEELRELVYPKNNGSSSTNRISKTCILNKAVSEIEKHHKELEQKEKDIERLEKSVTTLRILNSFYEKRAKGTIPQNTPAEPVSDELKFHIFKLFSDSMFASFESRVSLAPFSEFAECILRWLEDTCDQRFLSKLMDSVVSSSLPTLGDHCILPRAVSNNFCSSSSTLSPNQTPSGFSTNPTDKEPFKSSTGSNEWLTPSNSMTNNSEMSVVAVSDYPAKPNSQTSTINKQNHPLNSNTEIMTIPSDFTSALAPPSQTTPTKFNGYKRNSLPHDLAVVLRTQSSKAPLDSGLSQRNGDYGFSASHSTLSTPTCGPAAVEAARTSDTLAPKYPTLVFTPPGGSSVRPVSFGITASNSQYNRFF